MTQHLLRMARAIEISVLDNVTRPALFDDHPPVLLIASNEAVATSLRWPPTVELADIHVAASIDSEE